MNKKTLKTKILSMVLTLTMILRTSVTIFASNQTVTKNQTNGYTFYIHNSIENPTQATVDGIIKNNVLLQGQTYVIYFDNEAGRTSLKSLLSDVQLLGKPKNSVHRLALTTGQIATLEKVAVPMKTTVSPTKEQPKQADTKATSEEVVENKVKLYTDEQLAQMSAKAPTPTETKSAIKMTNTRMTEAQLNAWLKEYEDLGGANSFELEVVRLINLERAKGNLEPLAISQPLMMAARFKSQEMVDLDYYNHVSPVYTSARNIASMFGHENQRFKTTGNGTLTGAGENLGKGHLTAERIVNAWLSSPGHRKPIMSGETKTLGVGRVLTITTANFGY